MGFNKDFVVDYQLSITNMAKKHLMVFIFGVTKTSKQK